ncbi:hypothetical protein GYMLUDRAFT_400883 [Collybiopsis luxurians FD-317 M1]|nr:hypothetical protein GYMLUDRAFT_400883 [Collybiopsis luxurians FD-317 M1]
MSPRLHIAVCAGCGVAYYCSRECQKKCWDDHREECKVVRANRGLGPFPADARDLHFRGWVVQQDIRIYRDQLLREQAEYRSKRSLSSTEFLVTELDHRGVKVKRKILTVREARARYPAEDWVQRISEVKMKHEKDLPLVVSIIPDAMRPAILVRMGMLEAL